MRRISAPLLLVVLFSSILYSQTSNPRPPNTPPAPGESSSQQQAQPPSVPVPDDSPLPDLGTLPDTEGKKQSAIKRKLDDLKPHCIDIFALHTCWSQPPAPKAQPAAKTADDPEYLKDMDVGDFYLTERKNYKGAELRFRDALEHKPNDPTATFRLAQSLEGLGQGDEAKDGYGAYLTLAPNGPFVDQAKKALERLQARSAQGSDKPKPSPKDSHLR